MTAGRLLDERLLDQAAANGQWRDIAHRYVGAARFGERSEGFKIPGVELFSIVNRKMNLAVAETFHYLTEAADAVLA